MYAAPSAPMALSFSTMGNLDPQRTTLLPPVERTAENALGVMTRVAPVQFCHATRRKHEGWDTTSCPSLDRGNREATDLPVWTVLKLYANRILCKLKTICKVTFVKTVLSDPPYNFYWTVLQAPGARTFAYSIRMSFRLLNIQWTIARRGQA
ncbi:hypothetical protein CSKR_114236 [Clonorchis sinensis]|uniref:Uncharacterized protein n=1 Tax=Clonorchis sinensis TaxID=79923 RepID=A0A419Q659_CLOSI|nr:hypothetical protein CSKR_114236 [Clonorchis sinensis]